ncbi:MAG: hypothetical protein RRA92_00305 [Gemmatimonadota bacterium]|nr:hypothetical protein [Gemmatimonadota bacterium]
MRAALRTLLLAPLVLAGCGDGFDPIVFPNPSAPEDVVLSDFVSGTLQQPSAFDVLGGVPVRTDQSSNWDFVFAVQPGVGPVLQPRGMFDESETEAGVAVTDVAFEVLALAPEDGYATDAPTPIAAGDVVVVRSRRDPGFAVRCRLFGKFEVVGIDLEEGTLSLRHLINPNCERRELTPDEEG